jgi:hypothetical protein
MAKVCILNKTTNVVEDIVLVDDLNNIPDFIYNENQKIATDHTGEIGDTWNGSSYDNIRDNTDLTYSQNQIDKKNSARQKLVDLGLTVDEIKEAFGI